MLAMEKMPTLAQRTNKVKPVSRIPNHLVQLTVLLYWENTWTRLGKSKKPSFEDALNVQVSQYWDGAEKQAPEVGLGACSPCQI